MRSHLSILSTQTLLQVDDFRARVEHITTVVQKTPFIEIHQTHWTSVLPSKETGAAHLEVTSEERQTDADFSLEQFHI